MVLCPGADEEIDKYLKPGVVVSLTRIEPPLHPPGPEKIVADYGIEPEEFDREAFFRDLPGFKDDKITEGIFAPWAIMKEDFQSIGGHDPLFAPQSKEDSDIFNRFLLNGYKFVQTWNGFVYHMTCRGSRFKDGAKRNPDGQVFMKGRESDEWLAQNHRSTRNFIRKWGHFVKHDRHMKPIVPHKYDIGYVIQNCTPEILEALEPWCSTIYVDCGVAEYILKEQPNTDIDLTTRVFSIKLTKEFENDVVVHINGKTTTRSTVNMLQILPEILEDSGEYGQFELEDFRVHIQQYPLEHHEDELIKL
jgi:hypothetical protein